MPLTFYDSAVAPNPRRARIILAEKNVPHETVEIDLASKEQMGEAYRQINPNCTVPALQLDDGTILTDNAGIAFYLEAVYPEPPLMGTTPHQKAEIMSWHAKVESEFGWSVAHAFRNTNPAMVNRALVGPYDYPQIPALAERALLQIDRFFDAFDAHLQSRDYIAANQFSLVDISMAVMLDFARVVKRKPTDKHSNIKRWRAALNTRPSFAL